MIKKILITRTTIVLYCSRQIVITTQNFSSLTQSMFLTQVIAQYGLARRLLLHTIIQGWNFVALPTCMCLKPFIWPAERLRMKTRRLVWAKPRTSTQPFCSYFRTQSYNYTLLLWILEILVSLFAHEDENMDLGEHGQSFTNNI